ncbi:hypothetical protein FB45DRAFT_6044 [Roridomyces roridus]|uniref:BTB domain-containing protein n=1 Tax=Roridomyces roridus TaxID=1738132 RepID=A0AAD7CID6_9AGAR|nr:hypothetical protein FB45DRAFT_6044 [Roridomyces roridus]
MSESPPAKRQRPNEQEITRSSEVWHCDGSVVLQASGTQFRVHWSVLSQHSAFFRDLQGLPQPPDEPKVEECPVIELLGDSPEDVECVLKTLYDPWFFSQKPLTLSVVASHIRLGRKYDFKDILQAMVERLSQDLPQTLEGYDGLFPEGKYTPIWIKAYSGYCIDILALVKENNLRTLLPCAYLRVLQNCQQAQLFDGITRRDGTLATLAVEDQRLCALTGKKIAQSQWQEEHTFGWIAQYDGCPECTQPAACTLKRMARLHTQLKMDTMLALSSVANYMVHLGLCDACTEDGAQKMSEGRKKMWELLPTFFELPPWAELQNDI